MGEYSKALSSFERSLEIRKVALPPNHPDLAQSYNNIGSGVFDNMGEYSKALSYYERSLEIIQSSSSSKSSRLGSIPTTASVCVYNEHGRVFKSTFIF